MSGVQSQLRGEEPPMFLQRPSSARSQDVTHVLARTFRHLFTRDTVAPDTVRYLNTSRGGDDEYHEKYVDALQKIQEERDRRMAEAAKLEQHIMQAQARAMSADERELNRISAGANGFPDLGLPPARSHFRSCVDNNLLKKHKLLAPDDFVKQEFPVVPPPSGPDLPNYARETQSSSRRKPADRDMDMKTPFMDDEGFGGQPAAESEGVSLLASSVRLAESPPPPRLDIWKDEISPDQREQNRASLAIMASKADFLKNPRHIPPSAGSGSRSLIKAHKKRAKETGIKPKLQPERPKEPSTIFIPSPQIIRFTEYEVGRVYEMTLKKKKVPTATLR